MRPQARYLEGVLTEDLSLIEGLLQTLDDMERHVSHLAEAPLHELPEKFNVIAARPIQAGELVGPDATMLFPAPTKRAGS
jgi:hypothetical protein